MAAKLNVNTIEFDGRKAVINSYSDHPELVENMNRQREAWAANYPNATVRTERMDEADVVALVRHGRENSRPGSSYCWDIAYASTEAVPQSFVVEHKAGPRAAWKPIRGRTYATRELAMDGLRSLDPDGLEDPTLRVAPYSR